MSGPRFKAILEGLDLQTDLWWLALVATGLFGSVLGAFAFEGSEPFWVYLTLATRLCMVVYVSRQEWGIIFRRLLPLGLTLGIFSIFSDYMLIEWFDKGRMYYPSNVSPLLLLSPPYAMLGWSLRVVEFGYLVTRVYGIFIKRWPGETGLGLAMVVGGASSAILVGSREYLGAYAGWWSYSKDAHASIGNTSPVYTIAAAGLFFGILLQRFGKYADDDAEGIVKEMYHGGILAGLLFGSYFVSYVLIEGPFIE